MNGTLRDSQEALLSIHQTASSLRKGFSEFLRQYQLTDVQYHVLDLLYRQHAEITQVELSRLMDVNRANVTTLIDRMERAGLVRRVPVEGDRRCYNIHPTPRGERIYRLAQDAYAERLEHVLAPLEHSDLRFLTSTLETIRESLLSSGC